MEINAIRSSITVPSIPPIGVEEASGKAGFKDIFMGMLNNAEETMREADSLAESFAKGEPVDVHTLMTATTEADLSFRLLMEVRSKVVDAYQEVMRLPV